MSAPNRNTLWARTLVDELVAGGVDAVCIAPGSRSTPLTVAFERHPDVRVFSHLDERSAAYFALGRAKRTGRPTPLVSTSGTAAANFHPAVIEANQARVPLLVLTADRPPELWDSGANQTVDQVKLYGDAVRWYATLPGPEADDRKLRSLRTTAARSLAKTTGTPAGPVHLNVPFRKPLEPVHVPGDVPDDFAETSPLAATGRDGPFVETTPGTPALDPSAVRALAETLSGAERGLLVAGPADVPAPAADAIAALADRLGFPLVADPLSGLRFGLDASVPVLGGYDGYLTPEVTATWPDPDVVVRVGAAPTSKTLADYLERVDARQFVVDPAGGWREARFTATDLVTADPTRLARDLTPLVDGPNGDSAWTDRFASAESRYWERIEAERERVTGVFEGSILAETVVGAPDPATLFVSNSMPVRDLDRFGRPREAALTVLGNRGASGIDGVVSSALGAGSATDDPLVFVTGDLAYYHDMNGLLALGRCGVDATVVEINNDGGGIFHMLPIESFDPPFTGQFKPLHGLDFEPTAALYDLTFDRVTDVDAFRTAYEDSLRTDGTQVIEVVSDARASHRTRERLFDRVADALAE